MKRRVLGLTAIRSEYFLQRSILRSIVNHPDLELELVVAGAHLSPLHDETARTIEQDGLPVVERIDSLLYSDRDAARLKGAALQLQVLSHVIDRQRPDWLLAVGDREEPLALSLCGAYMNIPVAHYGAGDRVVGNADDTIRHAISRIGHLLLTTNEDARLRLIRAGEQDWRVHNVGHAGLDRLRLTPALTPSTVADLLGIPKIRPPYAVVIQHPLSSEIGHAGADMEETLAATVEGVAQIFVSYPNSDAGSHRIVEVIERYRTHPHVHVFRNIPDTAFVNLLRGAAVLLGNSSLGLLEAPFLRLPVINVGHRQCERVHAENVRFVGGDRKEILAAIRRLLQEHKTQRDARTCSNPFGDGHSGERVARLLATTPIDGRLLNKDLTF